MPVSEVLSKCHKLLFPLLYLYLMVNTIHGGSSSALDIDLCACKINIHKSGIII